ncbi:HNH endonuclease [Pseudothauera nasutitermitis]|uniref:HNH endonuclease n=1 Tax=Pseudothauera nasutitermitis TaxID=2565930 RepID=UPI001E5ABD3D|nr:HNH endonuclease [Pseudothauera nasutitermitis]
MSASRHPDSPAVFPWILALDVHGQPRRWIGWQDACHYHARGLVAWSLGERQFRIRGGLCRATGQRSEITTHSIIAIQGRAPWLGDQAHAPRLDNRELFRRDRQLCAYCGRHYGIATLTRDHIHPLSQGGRDAWMNVVTACRACNQKKSGRTPEQAGMPLLYAPYVPSKAEYLILCNRGILADQMDFLALHVPRPSRVRRTD